MDIQQLLEIGLPFIAAIISYAIQRAHWPDIVNTTVAGVSVLAAAAASVFLQGQLTGHVYADVLLIVTTAVALQAKSFLPLQQYLLANFPTKSTPNNADPTITTPPTVKDLTTKQ